MIISSHSNPNVKLVRSLRQRKERDKNKLFFIEGLRLVGEAVQMQAEIETLVVAPQLLNSTFGQELIEDQRQQGTSLLEVTPDVFESLSVKEGPQGIGAVMRQRWETLDTLEFGDGLCWVALESPQDPGNVGTIMRTGDAVNTNGLILLDNATDPYDPAALRASMGAIFSQRLIKASFAEFVTWVRKYGYNVVGTSDKGSVDYQETAYSAPLVLLMGSERQGLSPEQQAICNTTVRIPMVGRSDSLNLAVATCLVLYEIFNQKREK